MLRSVPVPFWMVNPSIRVLAVTPDGEVSVIYKGPVEPAQVIADLALPAGLAERVPVAAALPGRLASADGLRLLEQAETKRMFHFAADLGAAGRGHGR